MLFFLDKNVFYQSVFLYMRQQWCSVLGFSKVPALVTWDSICVWAKGQTAKKKKSCDCKNTHRHVCVCVSPEMVCEHTLGFLQHNKKCTNDIPIPIEFWSLWQKLQRRTRKAHPWAWGARTTPDSIADFQSIYYLQTYRAAATVEVTL